MYGEVKSENTYFFISLKPYILTVGLYFETLLPGTNRKLLKIVFLVFGVDIESKRAIHFCITIDGKSGWLIIDCVFPKKNYLLRFWSF